MDKGGELWNQDVKAYDAAPAVVDVLRRLNRDVDDGDVVYELTRSLVFDVVDAARGVARAFGRLQDALNKSQEVHAEFVAQLPGHTPTDGDGLVDDSTEDAWYSLEEMFIWSRTLDERLDRRSMKGNSPQGLIFALADGPLRKAVIQARSRFHDGGMREARLFVGLNLHMQPSRSGTKVGELRSGRIVLPFPDPITTPIMHRCQLTYEKERDGLSFANGLMNSVDHFMDDLIEALSTHGPTRFNRPEALATSQHVQISPAVVAD